MNISDGLVPEYLLWFADLAFVLVLGLALWRAPWVRLKGSHLHVFLGAIVSLLLLWSLKAGIQPGLNFHLLGGTLLMLMFGWELALTATTLVLLGVTIDAGVGWTTFALNALLMGALPILVSYLVFQAVVRFLPHHFFVYVIFNAYFCAGVAMAVTVLSASLLYLCCSTYTLHQLKHAYLPFAPFMIFGEGFFTGMMAASMALMRPEWIWSFDDRRYLAGK